MADYDITDYTISVYDTQEAEPSLSKTYVFESGKQMAGTNDVTPPVTTIESPVSLALDAGESVVVAVTDDSESFALIVLAAEFPSGDYEIVHDGTKFATRYAAGSTRAALSNGYRYTLFRTGGWPGSFTLRSFPVDPSGNNG